MVLSFSLPCLHILSTSSEHTSTLKWILSFENFELSWQVYRLYQLTKAAHFIQRLMFAMKDVPVSPDLLDRSGAMVAMLVTFQVVGAVCLWSWLTLLLRLFPSRPVVENY